MPDRDEVTEQTERDRQASQARAEQQRAQADADNAQDRADAQREAAGLDPNSPEGRQAAIRRGDPVQLTGEEAAHGMVRGTATTANESGSGFPASDEHNFVTGAAGVPIPASAGVKPQVPGSFNPDADERDMSPQDVAVHPQEAGEDRQQVGLGDEAQVDENPELSPQDQQVEDQRAAQQEAAEKEQDQAGKESKGSKGKGDKGDHGPGTSQ